MKKNKSRITEHLLRLNSKKMSDEDEEKCMLTLSNAILISIEKKNSFCRIYQSLVIIISGDGFAANCVYEAVVDLTDKAELTFCDNL